MDRNSYWNRSRWTRRQLLGTGAGASAGLAAWALAGCGDDDKPPASPATAPATTAAPGTASATTAATQPATAAAAQPKRGGPPLVNPNGGIHSMLDLHKTSSATTNYYGSGNAYSGLIRPQANGHKGVTIVTPDLAEKWEQPDNSTYIFKIRSGAKWQNIAPLNGRVLTTQDIEYSFNRQVAEKVNASSFSGVKSMKAIDATTYRIDLESPNVDFLVTLTAAWNKVVAKEAVELKGDLTNGPVIGTGPWLYTEQKGVGNQFQRNPDYFIPAQPYIDSFSIPYFPDTAVWEAQFLAGKVHAIYGATGGTGVPLKSLKAYDKKKFSTYQSLPNAPVWVMFQNDHPQMKDLRIRKALNLAVDRTLLNDQFDGEMTPDSVGLVLPGRDWLLPKSEIDALQAFDPKQAKQMFDAAGGVPKQTMSFFNSPSIAASAQIVQAGFKAIGFEVDLAPVDAVGLTGTIFNPANAKFALATTAISHGPTFTADLEAWYVTGGARNGGHWSDSEVDSLAKVQKAEFDEKKRRDLILQIQRRLAAQLYHASFGAIGSFYAFPSNLRGYEPTVGYGAHFQELWWDA